MVRRSTARGACDAPPCNHDRDVTLMCLGYFFFYRNTNTKRTRRALTKKETEARRTTRTSPRLSFSVRISRTEQRSPHFTSVHWAVYSSVHAVYKGLGFKLMFPVFLMRVLGYGFHWRDKRCTLNASLLLSWRRTVQKTSPRHRSRRALIISYSTSLPQGNVGCT